MASKTNMNKKKTKVNASKAKSKSVVVKSAPASVATQFKRPVPQVSFKSNGVCMITHTEYVSDVASIATPAKLIADLRINPQSQETFKWLAAFALRFEQYKFHQLKFNYKPSSSTSKNGYVVIGADFDAYDDPPNSKATMLAWQMARKCALWQEMTLDVSSEARIAGYKYCDVDTRGDARLDDLGRLYIFGETPDGPSTIGELYVTYTVEFRQPSFKGQIAQYWTMDPRPAADTSDYFTPTTAEFETLRKAGTVSGNIQPTWVAKNKILMKDPGDYLITVTQTGSSIVGIPSVTATVPIEEPSSTFSTPSSGGSAFSGTSAITTWLWSLYQGGGIITITAGSGTAIYFGCKISSYKR